jgi:hypothetical protein
MYLLPMIRKAAAGWRLSDVLIGSLLAAALLSNAVLLLRVAKLSEGLSPVGRSTDDLRPGDVVPSLSATKLDGTPTTVEYGDVSVPTILYVFTPQCGWCKRNLENVKTIARAATGHYRIIGVSLTSMELPRYLETHPLGFEVIHHIGPTVPRDYKLGGTPQTIVISPDGHVLKNWKGAYSDSLQRDVERYFGVTLPGLSQPVSSVQPNSIEKTASTHSPSNLTEVFK